MKSVKFILGGQIDAKTYTDTEKNKVWLSLQIFVKKVFHMFSQREILCLQSSSGQRNNNNAPTAGTDSHKTRAPALFKFFPPAQKSRGAMSHEVKLKRVWNQTPGLVMMSRLKKLQRTDSSLCN